MSDHSCYSHVSDYTNVVKGLIKRDKAKYSQYDNIARAILGYSMPDEAKALALHYTAHIYQQMDGLRPGRFTLGKSLQVTGMASVLGNTGLYLQTAQDLFQIKAPVTRSLDNLLGKIEKAGDSPLSVTQGEALIQELVDYFQQESFPDETTRQAEYALAQSALHGVIGSDLYLKSILDSTLEQLFPTRTYVPLDAISELAGLSNKIVYGYDGSVKEVSPEEADALDPKRVVIKDGRPAPRRVSNTSRMLFEKTDLMGGLTVRAMDRAQEAELVRKLGSLGDISSAVKVYAMPASPIADQRVQRMHTMAQRDPSTKGLLKRQHETFEHKAQGEALQEGKVKEVMTLSRPKASEQPYTLIGEIDGMRFHIYTPRNYVFLKADNTTETVDFTNPDHIQKVPELAAKRLRRDGQYLEEPVTEKDMGLLRQAQENSLTLDQLIAKAMENTSGAPVDITDEFAGLYTFRNSEVKQYTRLTEYVASHNERVSLKLEIVKVGDDGKPLPNIAAEVRKVPFIFFTYGGRRFDMVNVLEPNERILVDGKALTMRAYAEKTLGKDTSAAVRQIVAKKNPDHLRYAKSLILQFDETGSAYSYILTERNTVFQQASEFAALVTGIYYNALVSDRAQRVRAFKEFDTNEYSFEKLRTGGDDLFLNFSSDPHGNPTIEPYANSGEFAKFFNEEGRKIYGRMSYRLDKTVLMDMVEEFSERGAHIVKLKERFPHLKALPMTTREEVIAFMDALSSAIQLAPGDPVVQDFLQKTEQMQFRFGAMVKERVVDRMLAEAPQEIRDALTAGYSNPSTTEDQRFLLAVEKTPSQFNKGAWGWSPKIIVPPSSTRKNHNSNTDWYRAVTTDAARTPSLVSNSALEVTERVKPIQKAPEKTPSLEKQILRQMVSANTQETIDNLAVKDKVVIGNMTYQVTGLTKSFVTLKTPSGSMNLSKEDLHAGLMGNRMEVNKVPVQEAAPAPASERKLVAPGSNLLHIPLSMKSGQAFLSPAQRATERMVLREIDWLRRALPQFEVSEQDVREILDLAAIDGVVLGAFRDKVIYLNKHLKAKGTVYHEAMHGVFRYMLTPAKRQQLVNEIRADKAHAARFTQAAMKEFARERGLLTEYKKLEQLIAEEILAEGFQKYMNKKTAQAPAGLLGRLYQALKNLIRLFTSKSSEMDILFRDVARGAYASQVVSSGILEGQVAYELIPGLTRITTDQDLGRDTTQVTLLTVDQQKQLVFKLSSTILEMEAQGSKLPFENKFDQARRHLYRDHYTVDNWTPETQPEKRAAIARHYGELFNNYHYMLGKGVDEGFIAPTNLTGNPAHDQYANGLNGEVNLGEASMDMLKKEVKRVLVHFKGEHLDEKLDARRAEMLRNGEDIAAAEEQNEQREELGSADYDDNHLNLNVIDGIRKELRRFISMNEYESYNPELGIYEPRMADGSHVFDILVKITADAPPHQIINRIQATVAQYREDGFTEHYHMLGSVYNKLKKECDLDEHGLPRRNSQLYDQLIDVLHSTETEIDVMNHRIDHRMDPVSKEMYPHTSATLKDMLLKTDIARKKTAFTDHLLQTYEKGKTPEEQQAYDAAVTELQDLILGPDGMKSAHILYGENQGEQLAELTDRMHSLMQTVGFNFPKTLIRLSIMGIDYMENLKPLSAETIAPEVLNHFYSNFDLVADRKYLERDFMHDIAKLLHQMKGRGKVNVIKDRVSADSTDASALRFNAVLGKALTYVLKYDPADTPSSVRNAEGKPIYRYVRYTPSASITQSVRQRGLKDTLANSTFSETLQDWYGENELFRLAMEGGKTEAHMRAELFFKNIRTSVFGGVNQFIDGKMREGKTFAHIDDTSLHAANLLAFLQRETHSDTKIDPATGKPVTVTIETFKRTLTQLEASQTNFMVTGLYERYYDQAGQALSFEAGHQHAGTRSYHKMVGTLEGIVKQEFNRAQREWRSREARAQRQGGKLINKYNARYNDDGSINTSDRSLRAYKFRYLQDFFHSDITEKEILQKPEAEQQLIRQRIALREQLLSEALDNDTAYDQLPDDLRHQLLDALNEFAESERGKYLDLMEQKGLFRYQEAGRVVNGVEEKAMVAVSDLIPQTITQARTKGRSLQAEYGIDPASPVMERPNLQAALSDYFFNFWANSLVVNQLFDGDIALGVKNSVDYFKRNKAHLAAGSTMKEGLHRVAMLDTIYLYEHKDHLEYGQHASPEAARATLLNRGDLSLDFINWYVSELANNKDCLVKAFDGQSISLLMHQMDMDRALGRLDNTSIKILIAKQYRALTESEVRYLEEKQIVGNSKKTVTASDTQYLKQSEHLLDRQDISALKGEDAFEFGTDAHLNFLEETYDKLHGLYQQVYDKRRLRHNEIVAMQRRGERPSSAVMERLEGEIRDLTVQIHQYWEPLPHRRVLHDMLNSMEYHQIDQMMDLEGSKKTTLLPTRLDERDAQGYLPLNRSATDISNMYKYLQVETSTVKETSKASVQRKALLPADIPALRQMLEKREVSPEEMVALAELDETLLRYQETMGQIARSNMDKFTTLLRGGDGNFDIGQVYQVIQDSLIEQRASSTVIKLFEVDPLTGKPVHSPNLPAVRSMLEYYFFSFYSNNVSDEKVSGFKSFHVTSFGYELLYDIKTGQVIPTQQVRRNPARYSDPAKYATRYPGVVVDEYEDGTKKYLVECVIPRPFFTSPQHEQFYMEHMLDMFGTRIPTEDKRSMAALRAVDFIDSSYLNSIIVPMVVHNLSGSDLDIDSLYGQMFAAYKDQAGVWHKFGDYTGYPEWVEEHEAQFLEFFEYIQKHEALKPFIKGARKELMQQVEADNGMLPQVQEAADMMLVLGYEPGDINNIFQQSLLSTLREELDELRQTEQNLGSVRQAWKELFVEAKEAHERDPENQELLEARKHLGRVFQEFRSVHVAALQEKRRKEVPYRRALNTAKAYVNILSALRVMGEKGLPVSVAQFHTPRAGGGAWGGMVTPIHQNAHLESMLEMMGNEAIFRNLWIKELASPERFRGMLPHLGRTTEEISNAYNPFTISGVINSRSQSAMSKDGIMITATLNKFLATSSQYEFQLHEKDTIWHLTDPATGEQRTLDRYGMLNTDGERVISLVGNILGMFADGAKDPIPSALGMTEVSAGVTMAMMGVGVPPEMAVFMNFLPEIRRSVEMVRESMHALTTDPDKDRTMLHQALGKIIHDKDNPLLTEEGFKTLREMGVLRDPNATLRYFEIDSSRLNISFRAPETDSHGMPTRIIDTVNPDVAELGIHISFRTKSGPREMSAEMQRLILVKLFQQQAMQSFSLLKVGKVINLFKRLNPHFDKFDGMREALGELKHNVSIFRNSSNMFERPRGKNSSSESVYAVLDEMTADLDRQSARIFLERTPAFRPLANAFGPLFTDKKNLSNTVTALFALKKLQVSHNDREFQAVLDHPGIAQEDKDIILARYQQDRDDLNEFFKAEYWFGVSSNPGVITTMKQDLDYVKSRYPGSKFLSFIRATESEEKQALLEGVPDPRGQQYVEILSRGKLDGEIAEGVIDDYTSLLNSPDARTRRVARKLAYHEFVRGGLQSKRGMFLNLLNTDQLKEVSRFINEFTGLIEQWNHDMAQSRGVGESFQEHIRQFLKLETLAEASDVIRDLIYMTVHAASTEVDNKRFKNIRSIQLVDNQAYRAEILRFVKAENNKSAEAAGYVASVLELTGAQADRVLNANSFNIGEGLYAGGEIKVNLGTGTGVPEGARKVIAASLNIAHDEETKEFVFPVAMKIPATKEEASRTLMLTHLNGKAIETIMLDQIEGGRGDQPLLGLKARYEVVSDELSASVVNPLSLKLSEAKKLSDYARGIAMVPVPQLPGSLASVMDRPDTVAEPELPEQTPFNPNMAFMPDYEQDAPGYDYSHVEDYEAGLSDIDDLEGLGLEEDADDPFDNGQEDPQLDIALAMIAGVNTPAVEAAQEAMLVEGQYVSYQGEKDDKPQVYIITQMSASDATVQIYNPLSPGPKGKRRVSYSKLTPLPAKADFVSVGGKQYMVTPKGSIVSTVTYKEVFVNDTPERRRILNVREEQRNLATAPLSDDLMETLYQRIGIYKKLSPEDFRKQARQLMLVMQAQQKSQEEIENQLECL